MVDKIIEEKNTEEKVLDTETKTYELGYLIIPSVTEEKLNDESVKIVNVLEKDGSIISKVSPKEQELAYKMDKVIGGKKQIFDNAYFGSIIFETTSTNILLIKKELDKNSNILRFMIIERTKESLIAPQKRVATAQIDRAKEISPEIKNKEEKKKVDEKEIDKEIEDLVIKE